jgi:magnesium-transporting ATPase (P-type)
MIINLYGAPGAGKSTTRAGVFYQLKLLGQSIEEVPEVAKDLTHEDRKFALGVQPYVFGKQLKAMRRVVDKYKHVVTDSPCILSAFYGEKYNKAQDEKAAATFRDCCMDAHYALGPSLNYWIYRKKPYNPVGRNQTEDESNEIAEELLVFLGRLGITTRPLPGTERAVEEIVREILMTREVARA